MVRELSLCTVGSILCACSLIFGYHDYNPEDDTENPYPLPMLGESSTSSGDTDSAGPVSTTEQGGGNCCDPNSFPGCEEPMTEACVCQVDPFCCEVSWDSACVSVVEIFGCGFCGGQESFGSFGTFGTVTTSGGEDTEADTATDTSTDTETDPGAGIPVGDVRFGLVENNTAALAHFDLESTLAAIAGSFGSGLGLYENLIETYASEGRPGFEHCTGTLNGFPITCDRLEAQQLANLSQWFPIAVFNRVDLAPADGANCGQQRIIFANNAPLGPSRMFIILEGEVPNPNPGCGVAACQPIAAAWQSIAALPADERGAALRALFLTGFEGLSPMFRPEAFAPTAGQIRTNNFNQDPWTLREFKVVAVGDGVAPAVVPFPTAEAPPGLLWGPSRGDVLIEECQTAFLDVLPNLLPDDPAAMSFPVPMACRDAESRNDFSQFYSDPSILGTEFADRIETRLVELGSDLNATEIATRAQFAGSCIGCHEEATGFPLGHGIFAPFSTGFVHVSEFGSIGCAEGGQCRQLSHALTSSFLPHRRGVMDNLLSLPTCEPDLVAVEEVFGLPETLTDEDLSTIGGQSARISH